ncbi:MULTISPECIES: tyrosine-type recombinase/integrase [unclassified Cryobacterium]|uniref:tyrosine-type recombinase/integrase n=1 Tax=unclassified Cryobacterium TaxID=2649013 RepID=UPI00106BAE73|nr:MULTISPECIES: tyrosine-type recombinase/integrase [unclassified Cryobacterium]TFD04109.1 site-specific integrase [Cryobacterium sp. TMT1-66-1]TFD10547.1 site-specific integrase [Cryobacterium sp. TMT1-2-2]
MTDLAVAPPLDNHPNPRPRLSWTDYLQSRIRLDWRPGEFDPETLLYVPDPDDPSTFLSRCSKAGCDVRVQSKLCPICFNERKAAKDIAGAQFDLDAWLAIPRVRHARVMDCGILDCQRTALTTGLCSTHRSGFWQWRKKTGEESKEAWIADRNPKPLPPRPRCVALVCHHDAHNSSGLCDPHEGTWRKWRKRLPKPSSDDDSVEFWLNNHFEVPLDSEATSSYAELGATPFHLLNPTVRLELLFAVQQRDVDAQTQMLPLMLRTAYQALRRSNTATVVGRKELGLEPTHTNFAGFIRDLQVRIDEAQREWLGAELRPRGLYFYSDLDLTPSVKVVSRTASFDLTHLRLDWWADSIHSYLLEAGPHGRNRVQNTVALAPLVDRILSQRGTPPTALGRKDIDAVVAAIRTRWPSDQSQRTHIAAMRAVLSFSRLNSEFLPIWSRIPANFTLDPARHRSTGTISGSGRDSDESFRFVPQPIVDWMMDHLHLVRRTTPYRTLEAKMMLYMQERCGRRTSETMRLRRDCISYDSAGQAYLDWDRVKAPYGPGPRLPIHQDVHDAIREWVNIQKEHEIESDWLFPAVESRKDKPRSASFLVDRMSDFVSVIEREAPFPGEVEGVEGNLIYFDLSTIDPYAFRHAFAQRHADATDENGRSTFQAEDLQRWMGHKSYETTMGYFRITARRQRHALSALPSRRLNFLGLPVVIDRERDAFGKIAVSLGTCSEASNVAAGGHNCALEHACESCPFFLIDPFEKDGLAAKRLYLKAQVERVSIIAPDSHMIDHYTSRISDCDRIIAGIDIYIAGLPEPDRLAIESALTHMAGIRRRATASRRIDLRQILRES